MDSMTIVVVGATMWLLISLAFILDSVEAPRRLTQAALAILCLEFVGLLVASYRAGCAGGPCLGGEGIGGLSPTAVVYMFAGLAAAFTFYVIAYGLRQHRRARS